jgi:hypothetical protein
MRVLARLVGVRPIKPVSIKLEAAAFVILHAEVVLLGLTVSQ